jgi:4-amino-4-deoxy-L-arabinose transferase-like glycosyltransferase
VSEPDARVNSGRAWRDGGAWTLGGFLLVYLLLAVGSAGQKSVTVDELGQLPSGVYFLQTGDARYTSLNPPLVNALSALPVLFLDLGGQPPPPSDDVFSFWSTGYHFHQEHREDYLRIFAIARWMPILVVAGLGGLLFFWGRQLAPEAPKLAGLLAAGFVLFSPNVLAQARLVGTDTGTAFFVALAHWGLARMLKDPRRATTLACGVALGLAQLTKFYALLLYPAFLFVTLAWPALSGLPRSQGRRLLLPLAAAAAISLVVLNSAYLWQEVGSSLSDLRLQSAQLQGLQDSPVGALPLPLPGSYVRAFDGQLVEISSSLPSFLFGESFQGGRWYFYLALLAVKTPIALMLALGVALLVSFPRPGLAWSQITLLLAYPVMLFAFLSASDGRQLGSRALLSAVPLVWLWAAASVARAQARGWPPIVASGALAAALVTSLWSYPHYLSYFNAFAGGSQEGYRYAATADVDIGQDLVLLSKFLKHEGADSVQLLYFGSVDPALYGIHYEIPTDGLKPGLLAVSVSLYRTEYTAFDHGVLRMVGPVEVVGLGEPIARLGGSIHVYRVGPEPAAGD